MLWEVESQQGGFNIYFPGKPEARLEKAVCVGQTQSSLGRFRLAPPPLAVSEAIQRPEPRQIDWKVKSGVRSLELVQTD